MSRPKKVGRIYGATYTPEEAYKLYKVGNTDVQALADLACMSEGKFLNLMAEMRKHDEEDNKSYERLKKYAEGMISEGKSSLQVIKALSLLEDRPKEYLSDIVMKVRAERNEGSSDMALKNNWTQYKDRVDGMLREGLTVNQIAEKLGVDQSSINSFRTFVYNRKKVVGETVNSVNSVNKDAKQVPKEAAFAKQAGEPLSKSTGVSEKSFDAEEACINDMFGDYADKVKALTAIIRGKERELELLKSLRVDYARLCQTIKPKEQ